MSFLKKTAKSFASRNPHFVNRLWQRYYLKRLYRGETKRAAGDAASGTSKSRQQVFSSIFRDNIWQNGESVSGFGSTLYNTTILRKALPNFVQRHSIRTILDAPCGDFNWMQHVKLPKNVEYIGCDIVPDLIEALSQKYQGPGRSFRVLDIVDDAIPSADLWLCRDTLFHLNLRDAMRVISSAANSKIRFFASTTYDYVETNHDIETGQFRFINLTKPPFNLPEPFEKIDDYLAPSQPRKLGIWTQEQLADFK